MIIKCKMCGGDLRIEEGTTVAECEYCGTKQTVPNADNEKKIKLFERANRLRAACEFDKAAGVYESIVADFDTEAEAYWGLILCKFGVEYVDDPATGDKVPTCHRSSFDSVLEDPNFELVMENSDAISRKVYRDEAKAIEELRRSIIEVSSKEEPYDVFISYKELDASGERTIDSVIAQDIYKELTNEGYRVFFSRISLESKLGVEYEPYIFAALNSARVMIVVGTDYDNFNAVWVKNEWSRYLALIASGQKKTLIPCFKNIDAYDMPREFNKLAAQDMGKVGAMQDLLRGAEKLLGKNEGSAAAHSDSKSAAEPLLTRAFMFLEDGNWKEADKYCEKVLDQDPENAQAYLGKLMAECCVRRKEELKDCRESFDDSSNFKKVVRFGDKQLVDELESYSDHIYERNENDRLTRIYRGAVINMKDANTEEKFKVAAKKFESIHGFKDADEKRRQCLEKAEESRKDAIYHAAIKDMERDARLKYGEAISKLESIRGWRDADKKIQECSDRLAEIERKREEQRIADEKADKERRIAAQKAAEKKKRILSIAIPAVIAVVAFVLVLIKVIIPNIKYNAAVELMESGEIIEAYESLMAMDGYKGSAEKAANIYDQYEFEKIKSAEAGDIVYFGNYEQDNDTSNGAEKIEWQVLAKENNKVLVISKYALDSQHYNTADKDVTWETCTLRTWLNGTFLNSAFSTNEQTVIAQTTVTADGNPEYDTDSGNATTDKVFLLSIDEANKYFSSYSARQCKPTAFTLANGVWWEEDGGVVHYWRLRSPGGAQDYTAVVSDDGSVACYGFRVDNGGGAIRPAMWINLAA